MPGLPSAHSGLQGAFNNQVVHANTTLNAFVGGKQKAWMLNAPPVQPSRRPPPPSRPQQAQQPTSQPPTTPANVLPSPAPSDEPSPAVSNPRDSPNPRTLSVTATPQRQITGQVQTIQPATLADFNLRPGDTTRAVTEAVAGEPGRPPITKNATADAPIRSLQSPLAMAPPHPPHEYQTGPVADAPRGSGPVMIDLESPTVHMPPTSDGGGNPNKRRRVETSSPSVGVEDTPISDLAAMIDARIFQKGGPETLKPDVERPRFQILRDACDRKDMFYITMHQLYCLWSIDHQMASNLLHCDPESVRIGFGILESVLKKNSGFSKSNLLWCARFPGRSLEWHRNPTVKQIAAFLSSLSRYWTSLHDNLFNRLYPYLMDELVGKLQCYSTVLQKILFTAARRRLGVSDGPLGMEIDGYFERDQEDHFIDGQYRSFVFPNDPDGLEKRNEMLIRRYRQILTKAKAEQELLGQKQQQRSQQQQQQQQQPQQPQQQQQQQQQQYQPQQQQHQQQQVHHHPQQQQQQHHHHLQHQERQQQQTIQQRQAMLHQQFSQQYQAQRMQAQSPHQAFIQQNVPSQAATPHLDHQYEQNRIAASNHVRRASRQNSRPEKLVVRRGTHHGKDLPVELTDFMVPGVNMLKVALTSAAPHKKAKRFYMAVEILETFSHSQVLRHVWANGLSDREETLEKIRKRVNAVPEEDGIAVIDRTGTTTSELSIDLTDPFSAAIFAVPARGATCTHMECFDLETWLNTRPTKQAVKCGHMKTCTCPKYVEPSDPDKWKCPICFADARPRSLRIDRFLLDVRQRLEELNKLDTKSILVAVDGTWRPVAEMVDDDDAGSDGDGPTNRGPVAALRKEPSKSASVERAVEIIEID
ncbi:hypothetical protein VMCG_08183 [Cytospora schulzeri]|uniref:Uncharacterized protein n=1 Tax=Cytospora schulzeri TaxID=448051 RepID=A0A423VUD2_9PEZI|nr:hypothetical protein VMCG_08183 [Valsa malicola]